MSFDVEWTKTALSDLEKLEIFVQKRIVKKVDEFAIAGSFHGIRRVVGELRTYRLRVGNFRVIFEFDNNVVYVMKVGHRESIY